MPTRVPVRIDGGFAESTTAPFSLQDALNLYPYNPMTSAASQGGLLQIDGIESFSSLSFGVTAAIMHKGVLYVTSGTGLYSVSSSGASTLIGTIGSQANTPQMASNGEALCVQIPEGNGFFYDSTNGFRQITDSVYTDYQAEDTGVLSVDSIDGYFLFCTSKTVFHTDLVTESTLGTDFPALAFASGEDRPDNNMRVMRFKGELYLFGTESYEVWRNVGTEPFAFARIDGATQDKGIISYNAVTNADNTFFFVGGGPNEELAVWRASDSSPQKISTEMVDAVINSGDPDYDYLSSSWSYSLSGHVFIGFTVAKRDALLQVADETMVYDLTASAIQGRPIWHRRRSPNSSYYTVKTVIKAYGKILAGCDEGVGELREDLNTEFGFNYERSFTTTYTQNSGDPLFIDEIQLRCEAGTGLPNWDEPTANKNPKVKCEYSDDFGATWLDKGEKELGSNGLPTTLQSWTRIGRLRNTRVFRFSITTGAKVAFVDMYLEVEGSVV